jgi:hypothetical protein
MLYVHTTKHTHTHIHPSSSGVVETIEETEVYTLDNTALVGRVEDDVIRHDRDATRGM